MMRTYWPLLIFYTGFQGWVLSFPLFGPVLYPFSALRGIDPEQVVPIFLLCFSLSIVLWGMLLFKWKPDGQKLRAILRADVFACLALGLSLLWVPAGLSGAVFAALGILGSLPSMVWLTLVKDRVEDGRKGIALGITGLAIESLMYTVSLVSQHMEPLTGIMMVHAFLIAPVIILQCRPHLFDFNNQASETVDRKWTGLWPIFLLIFVIYLVGGVMYQVVHPFLAEFPVMSTYYGNLPYAVAMLFVGWLADRRGIRPLALFGMVGLGLAYTVFSFDKSLAGATVGNTFVKIGFAFLDLFVLYSLTLLAPRRNPTTFIGLGIGVNIFSILLGVWLSQLIVPFSVENYSLVYLTAIAILFVSFLLVEWVGKQDVLHRGEAWDLANLEKKAHYDAIDEELRLAKQVQQNMLPKKDDFPAGCEVAAALEVAKEVGGDFYDVIPLGDNRTLFVVGDVMGKGLPAALIMSSVVGQIRSEADYGRSLTELLQHVNRILIRDSRVSMYVTMGLALVDGQSRTLTYASAGHLFPFLVQGAGISQIEQPSLPLGIDPEIEYEAETMPFDDGDLLVLYTDGLVEIKNADGEMYGFKRLEDALRMYQDISSIDHFGQMVMSDVQSFVGGNTYEDDVTLVMARAKYEW